MAPRPLKLKTVELFPQQGRTKGKHVSHAIHDIMKSLYPDRFEDRPIDIVRANLGNALERMIIQGLVESDPRRYCRPGELELEDWYGTPDLWDLGPSHGRVTEECTTTEMKLTWASLNRAEDIEDSWFWRYWTQLKAYSHMAGFTKGRLYICFINGNYSRDNNDPNSGPQIRGWEDTWTVDELQENWQMLKARC